MVWHPHERTARLNRFDNCSGCMPTGTIKNSVINSGTITTRFDSSVFAIGLLCQYPSESRTMDLLTRIRLPETSSAVSAHISPRLRLPNAPRRHAERRGGRLFHTYSNKRLISASQGVYRAFGALDGIVTDGGRYP